MKGQRTREGKVGEGEDVRRVKKKEYTGDFSCTRRGEKGVKEEENKRRDHRRGCGLKYRAKVVELNRVLWWQIHL